MGLHIGLRYLMGWAQASHPSNRELPEWPPHPDRIFMALAAAHFESDQDGQELQALNWLESQSPPTLYVSRGLGRKVVTSYVPVNDTQMSRWKAGTDPSADQMSVGLSLLPSNRNRQARQFPTVMLENEVVYLEWSQNPSVELRAALEGLCQKVTRVGHSSSLVQMWVEERFSLVDNQRKLCPSEDLGAFRLRVSSHGRLGLLSRAFAAGRRPPTAPYRGYREVSISTPSLHLAHSEFSPDILVLTARPHQSRRFALTSAQLLAHHLRSTLLSKCHDPLPEWISGHLPGGGKSERAHLAIVPLPHIGREHADGHLLGIGLVVPREHAAEAGRVLGAALLDPSDHSPAPIRITAGRAGDWEVCLEDRDEVQQALQAETWTSRRSGSRWWGTVTPFVLDRHSKGKFAAGAEAAVRAACKRIGLPEPSAVEVSKVSIFQGVPSVFEFPPLLRKDGSLQQQVHCVVQFSEPIVGPVLIGAGRYRGYGFCRPLREKGGLL